MLRTKAAHSEEVAQLVFEVMRKLDGRSGGIVRQLWTDREYMLLRLKIIAEDCEVEGDDHNSREVIGEWAREAFDEVASFDGRGKTWPIGEKK